MQTSRFNFDGFVKSPAAALRFIREVLPLLLRKDSTVRFLAVGKNPPAELVALAAESGDAVVVTGFVKDVRAWVHPAAVYVVPIRYGSGTRLKVLEAFALGKATVSTAIGAEGIETHEGRDILIRDEPAAMAEAIFMLLEDRERAASLGREARAHVERNYDWARIGELLANVHRELGADDEPT